MEAASYIAGDWGTSHLRLSLCDAAGHVLESRRGPGAAGVAHSDHGGAGDHGRAGSRARAFAHTFASLAAHWEESHGTLPAVLCGMVGSSIGWSEAPYVACPARPEQLVDACVTPRESRVHIVPGLSCRNRLDAPDFMRGEETQILGALQLASALRSGTRLLCLPGTHTKWVALQDGVVREFMTAPTGELYAVLCEHSVLVRKPASAAAAIDTHAFQQGLAQFGEFPHAQLLHRLFECRSRQLAGELAAAAADAFLSGLLIGSDVHGALRLLSDGMPAPVYLIGAAQLTRLYALALRAQGRESIEMDGAAASLAGLAHVHGCLSAQVALHG
jgi:2-dehydro-3-deoxygalactonokinase